MNELTIQIIKILLVSLLFAIPGELIDIWLAKNGYVQRCKGCPTIGVFALIIIKELAFQNLSWWIYSIIIILGLVFGLHRGDLWTTMRRGKWWWKSEN
jgi:hypothetical protein